MFRCLLFVLLSTVRPIGFMRCSSLALKLTLNKPRCVRFSRFKTDASRLIAESHRMQQHIEHDTCSRSATHCPRCLSIASSHTWSATTRRLRRLPVASPFRLAGSPRATSSTLCPYLLHSSQPGLHDDLLPILRNGTTVGFALKIPLLHSAALGWRLRMMYRFVPVSSGLVYHNRVPEEIPSFKHQ